MFLIYLHLPYLIAQVNINLPPSFAPILGVILCIFAILIYLMRISGSELKQIYYMFLATAWFLCGFILILQGWYLSIALQFCQLLLFIFTITYTLESIRLQDKSKS